VTLPEKSSKTKVVMCTNVTNFNNVRWQPSYHVVGSVSSGICTTHSWL